MNKDEILEEYFLEARANLLDLAAFLDRLDRASGQNDYRSASIFASLRILIDNSSDKTRRVLECFSDPSTLPVDSAPDKAATGAWAGFTSRI